MDPISVIKSNGQKMNIVVVVWKRVVEGASSYHCRCRTCGWMSRVFSTQAGAVKAADDHRCECDDILSVLMAEFGCVWDARPTFVLWAADKAADMIGVEATKRQLSALNRLRDKRGVMVAVPEFGHRLF